MANFETALAGKVALVTGANAGIGRVTALELARRGAHVFLACRSLERAQPIVSEIKRTTRNEGVEALALDLGDFGSIRACAQNFLGRGLPLQLLINNAGLAGARGLTQSGFELAFGVNHVGHFLLTTLLLGRVRESVPARVVTVASGAHFNASGIDFEAVRKPTSSITGQHEYAVSKLANVLFSAELAHQLEGSGVTTYALHPGVVASEIWRRVPWPARSLMKLFMLTPEQGAETSLYCATSPRAANETGLYYDKCEVARPSRAAADAGLARRLWEKSSEWTAPARG